MKRKFKLFATVASLCLSVALMAFGVYAATQVTYTVSGNVSYTVQNALVTIQTKTAYVTDKKDGYATGANAETLGGLSYANEANVGTAWSSYNTSTGLPESDLNGTQSLSTLSFNTSTVWKVTINVKTINESGVYVALADETFAQQGTNYGIVAEEDYTNGIQVTKDEVGKDFVFYIYLKDVKVNVSSESNTFSIKLNIDQTQENVVAQA